MDLKNIVEDVLIQVAEFRALLVEIGRPQELQQIWEKIRLQRKHAIDSCRHARLLLVKFPESTPEDKNQQLDNLCSCVQWLLKEMKTCKTLAETVSLSYFPVLNELEHLFIQTDMKQGEKLLGEIHFCKRKVSVHEW